MSYCLWLEIDTGGDEPAVVCESIGMTSNVAAMWRKAGADLAEFKGRRADETIDVLGQAIVTMDASWSAFEAMNPPNGWGDAEGCRKFLSELLDLARAHPKATWRVLR